MPRIIFEQTTSALYYSNDGRLRLETVPGEGDRYTIDTRHVLALDGVEVFATQDRVKADAYIAGYDLAMGARLSQYDADGAALRRAADELGIDLP